VFYREQTRPLVGFLVMQGANVALAVGLVQETQLRLQGETVRSNLCQARNTLKAQLVREEEDQ